MKSVFEMLNLKPCPNGQYGRNLPRREGKDKTLWFFWAPALIPFFSIFPFSPCKEVWNHSETSGNLLLYIDSLFPHIKINPILFLQKCICWFLHNDFNFFLASQIFIPICQQQISVTRGDKVLFMLRFPIFICLTAFLKDDASENKMQHLSLFGWLWEVEFALFAVIHLVHIAEASQPPAPTPQHRAW